jgi:ABC-type dipeptide/oligopeptide/nickel transport system permease subunit
MAPRRDDARLWALLWLGGMGLLLVWNAVFLNAPAMRRVQEACVNSAFGGLLAVAFSLAAGWGVGLALHFSQARRSTVLYAVVAFAVNIVRSVPQILGILLGYAVLTALMASDTLRSAGAQSAAASLVIGLWLVPEVADLVRGRIDHFRRSDFYDAMLCCGVSEARIINRDILWKNSRAHLLHKAVALFGTALFLQCSIDFVISVGLSSDVATANFPVTLGSLLARLDSKQDILALGTLLSDPLYVTALVTRHLQGISVAFVMVFSLVCIYRIANGLVRRFGL